MCANKTSTDVQIECFFMFCLMQNTQFYGNYSGISWLSDMFCSEGIVLFSGSCFSLRVLLFKLLLNFKYIYIVFYHCNKGISVVLPVRLLSGG